MVIKITRLGFTESALLCLYWTKTHTNIGKTLIWSDKHSEYKNNTIKWLYTTSGYYDNSVTASYFDAKHDDDTDPLVYSTYMERVMNFIKGSDICCLCFSDFKKIENNNVEEFIRYISAKKYCNITPEITFQFMTNNKNVLIISPFADLAKEQYVSGNLEKIHGELLSPKVDNLYTYTFPYTFFNKGEHNNILEQADFTFSDILKSIDSNLYDGVLINCGAYSCIIGEKMTNIGKNICIMGGLFSSAFGILTNRRRQYLKTIGTLITNEEYWITKIPDKYKPQDYMKIEGGCYWD